MKVFVIVPAAGLGTRMARRRNEDQKESAFQTVQELGGIPILIHTLRKFVACPEVYEIVVALRKNEIAGFRTQLEKQYPEILNKRLQTWKVESTARIPWPARWRQWQPMATTSYSFTMGAAVRHARDYRRGHSAARSMARHRGMPAMDT